MYTRDLRKKLSLDLKSLRTGIGEVDRTEGGSQSRGGEIKKKRNKEIKIKKAIERKKVILLSYLKHPFAVVVLLCFLSVCLQHRIKQIIQ